MPVVLAMPWPSSRGCRGTVLALARAPRHLQGDRVLPLAAYNHRGMLSNTGTQREVGQHYPEVLLRWACTRRNVPDMPVTTELPTHQGMAGYISNIMPRYLKDGGRYSVNPREFRRRILLLRFFSRRLTEQEARGGARK